MLILDVCHLGIHARLHTGSRLFPERGWLILQTTCEGTVTDILQERTQHQCLIPTFITHLPHPPGRPTLHLNRRDDTTQTAIRPKWIIYSPPFSSDWMKKKKTHTMMDYQDGGVKRDHRRNIYRICKYDSATAARLKSDFYRGWPRIM